MPKTTPATTARKVSSGMESGRADAVLIAPDGNPGSIFEDRLSSFGGRLFAGRRSQVADRVSQENSTSERFALSRPSCHSDRREESPTPVHAAHSFAPNVAGGGSRGTAAPHRPPAPLPLGGGAAWAGGGGSSRP